MLWHTTNWIHSSTTRLCRCFHLAFFQSVILFLLWGTTDVNHLYNGLGKEFKIQNQKSLQKIDIKIIKLIKTCLNPLRHQSAVNKTWAPALVSRSFSESCWQRIAAPNEPSPTCLSEKSCMILKPKRRLSQSLLQKKSWYVWHHFDIWYLLVSDILSMKSDEPFWESCSGACLEFTRLWCQNEACWCWTLRRFPKAFWHDLLCNQGA